MIARSTSSGTARSKAGSPTTPSSAGWIRRCAPATATSSTTLVADLPAARSLARQQADRAGSPPPPTFTSRLQAAWRRPRLPRLALPDDDRRRYVVGRGSACDLVLADLTVSRVHAELRREDDGGWMLVDLGSLNGTRLNGWRLVGPAKVRSGDEISFGDCGFLVAASRACRRA